MYIATRSFELSTRYKDTVYGISIVVLNALTNQILSEQQNEYAHKYNWSIMGCNRYIYIDKSEGRPVKVK